MLQPLAPLIVEPRPHEPHAIVAHCELGTLAVAYSVDGVSHDDPLMRHNSVA